MRIREDRGTSFSNTGTALIETEHQCSAGGGEMTSGAEEAGSDRQSLFRSHPPFAQRATYVRVAAVQTKGTPAGGKEGAGERGRRAVPSVGIAKFPDLNEPGARPGIPAPRSWGDPNLVLFCIRFYRSGIPAEILRFSYPKNKPAVGSPASICREFKSFGGAKEN
jgi:hypothetical protein